MKEYKIFYIKETDTQPAPDDGYRKLYPKEDGWYSRAFGEAEIKIGSLIIVDPDDVELIARDRLKFGHGFSAIDDSDRTLVNLAWGESDFAIPVHDNDAHSELYATDFDLTEHLNDAEPHGIVLTDLHIQNSDTILAEGTANEVTAAQLKQVVDANISTLSRRVITHSGIDPYQVQTTDGAVIADSTSNNIDLVLPDAPADGTAHTFRLASGLNAMTATRSGTDTIEWNGNSWLGVTTDDAGTWFKLEYTDGVWYVTMDSGISALNEAT